MSKDEINKKLDYHQLKIKAANYCAYQDRSSMEVYNKLKLIGASVDTANAIIRELIKENFIDEKRFAEAYARGKFNNNHWGKVKIGYALQQKGIAPDLVADALHAIDDESYVKTIKKLVQNKSNQLKLTDDWIRKNKIAQYVSNKGFEANLVLQVINDIL